MSVTTRHWPGVMAQQTKTLRLLPLPSYAHSLPADLPAISIKTTRVTSASSLQKPHDDTTSIFLCFASERALPELPQCCSQCEVHN